MSKDTEKRYLYIDGQKVAVSEQVYKAYWEYTEKERYFMGKPKQETFVYDPEAEVAALLPSREDSYERLLGNDQQFATGDLSIEEQVVTSIWLDNLMRNLSENEREIIHQLYFLCKSEREACAALHMARTTFQRRKIALLEKLRIMLNENL